MWRKICSLILILGTIPFVTAETFELPGCIGTANLGVNAREPKDLISEDCHQITFRSYLCGCKNGTISLFSKNDPTEYDLIFVYEDAGVKKTERFDNVVFTKTYANKLLNNTAAVFVLCFVGAIIIPSMIILFLYLKNGQHR